MTKWYKKFVKDTEMYFMFQDFWNLVQDYWNVEDTDEYWDTLIEACGVFLNKYRTHFAARLVQAFINEQERKRKGIPDDMEACFALEQEARINAKKKHV